MFSQPVRGPLPDLRRHELRALVVLAELVGETGVRVGADVRLRDPRELLDVLPELLGPQGAVQAELMGSACLTEW
jgi:hypothetical protein